MAVSSSSAGPCAPRVWARGASPRATVVSKMAATPHPGPLPQAERPAGGSTAGQDRPWHTGARGVHPHPCPLPSRERGNYQKAFTPVSWRFLRRGCLPWSGHESLYHGGGVFQLQISDWGLNSRRQPGFALRAMPGQAGRGEIPPLSRPQPQRGRWGKRAGTSGTRRCAPTRGGRTTHWRTSRQPATARAVAVPGWHPACFRERKHGTRR